MEWSVEFDFAGKGQVDAEVMIEALETLDPMAPSGTFWPDRYSIRVSVDSPTIVTALKEAQSAIKKAIRSVGLPRWNEIRSEVIAGEELERVLAQRNYPELMGVAELSEFLDVSRQRASELASQSNFPKPVAHLTATPVWDKATIGNFLKEWRRTPGRPPATIRTGGSIAPKGTVAQKTNKRTTGRARRRRPAG